MAIALCAEADTFRYAEKGFDYAVKMTKKLGLKYLEPEVMTGRCLLNVYGFCNITSLEDDPMEMRKMMQKAGIKAPCLSAHSNLLNTEYGVDYLRKAIRFAYILGAPIVNTSEGPKPEWMSDCDAFKLMKFNIDTLVKTAENYGLVLTIEPHGVYTTDPEGLCAILDLNKSRHFGCNFDTGNVTCAGRDAVKMLEKVIRRVVHVHLKDVKRMKTPDGHDTGTPAGCPIGQGEVDIEGCIRVLKKNRYKGVLSIEVSGVEALKESIAYLKPLVA